MGLETLTIRLDGRRRRFRFVTCLCELSLEGSRRRALQATAVVVRTGRRKPWRAATWRTPPFEDAQQFSASRRALHSVLCILLRSLLGRAPLGEQSGHSRVYLYTDLSYCGGGLDRPRPYNQTPLKGYYAGLGRSPRTSRPPRQRGSA